MRRGTCGRPEAQVPHRAPRVLHECGDLKGCKVARIVVHHGALRPHQVVHKILVSMAKSEDMPKLVSNDRFKVVALETTARAPGVMSSVPRRICSRWRRGEQPGIGTWLCGAHSWMTSKKITGLMMMRRSTSLLCDKLWETWSSVSCQRDQPARTTHAQKRAAGAGKRHAPPPQPPFACCASGFAS